MLAYSTLFGQETGEDFDFIQKEGEVLKDVVAPWFGTLFWMAGFFKLLSTTLGNFDYVSRISADAVKINAAPDSRRWTESRIYAATVWLLVVVGVVILLTITEQPLLLIVISSALSAGVMFIYSILLIVLNRKRAAGGDPAQRLPARDHRLLRRVVRLLLDPRHHRVRRAAVLMRPIPALRVRVLLALVVWMALIGLAQLVQAVV